MKNYEIITAAEALTRVGLGDLVTDSCHRSRVEWAGYPRPFSCGHTGIYGSGPAKEGLTPDRKGSHREYQEK